MKKTFTAAAIFIIAMAATLTQSCSKSDNNTHPASPTLYDSLGGTVKVQDPNAASGVMIEQGYLTVRSIIDSTIFVIAVDPQINPYFMVLLSEVTAGNLSGFEELSKNLTDFFSVGAGAKDYTYTGLSMHDAHDPSVNSRISAKVQSDDFTEFENDVVAGAGKNGVAATDPRVASLAVILESLRSSVVNQ